MRFTNKSEISKMKDSAAAAAVRTNLYRKAAKDAEWIKGKKFVIWCFSAREFTESASGWPKVPVLKK